MITNLAQLDGGPKLIHEISRLDMFRYNYQQTQRLIERVQDRGYGPTSCKNKDFEKLVSKLGVTSSLISTMVSAEIAEL